MKGMTYPNLFKNRYRKLVGTDWLCRVDPDDKKPLLASEWKTTSTEGRADAQESQPPSET